MYFIVILHMSVSVSNLFGNMVFRILFFIVHVYEADMSSMMTKLSTSLPPVDLQDIGYDGTWEQFCDPKEIEKDFPDHPEHELRIMRSVLCNMKDANNITRDSLPAFAGYKYCAMMRHQAEDLMEKLLKKLSHGETDKRTELLTNSLKNQNPLCFERAENAFKEKCIHQENAYFRMFRPILARACIFHWLNIEDILSYIEEVCKNNYMSGKGINWNAIMNTINFTD